MAQYGAAQALALELRGQVEVFDPLLIGFGADRNDARRGARNVDNKGMRGLKAGEEALPDANGVPAAEAFEVGPHDLGTELRNP